jgi:hypothetical protein
MDFGGEADGLDRVSKKNPDGLGRVSKKKIHLCVFPGPGCNFYVS